MCGKARAIKRATQILSDWFGAYPGELKLQPLQADALARELVQAVCDELHPPVNQKSLIETVPDAWERFEKTIGKIVPPKLHKPKPKPEKSQSE